MPNGPPNRFSQTAAQTSATEPLTIVFEHEDPGTYTITVRNDDTGDTRTVSITVPADGNGTGEGTFEIPPEWSGVNSLNLEHDSSADETVQVTTDDA